MAEYLCLKSGGSTPYCIAVYTIRCPSMVRIRAQVHTLEGFVGLP